MNNRSVLDWPHGVSVYHPEKCYNGYTLVHGRFQWDPVAGNRAQPVERWHLIDMKGRVVHRWFGDPVKKGSTQLLERVANGNYVSEGWNVTEQDWAGNVVWQLPQGFASHNGQGHFHHDVQKTPEGNYLLLTAEKQEVPSLSKVRLLNDRIIEVTADKRLVWDWWAHEHIEEFGLSDEARKTIFETGGGQEASGKGDWIHSNTLSALPPNDLFDRGEERFRPGNLLSCSRDLNTIFIIDKTSGHIVWKWGYLAKMSNMWINAKEAHAHYLIGPHDPKMLHNGNILVYDNGGGTGYPPINRFFTRLVEVNPMTDEVVWQYCHKPMASKWLSIVTGGAQRLPNGNTLSLDTDKGRVFEVTPHGEIVWEFINPRGGFYRTQRIAYEDCPQADPFFRETDGHLGIPPARAEVPKNLGLPVAGTPDYCPRFR